MCERTSGSVWPWRVVALYQDQEMFTYLSPLRHCASRAKSARANSRPFQIPETQEIRAQSGQPRAMQAHRVQTLDEYTDNQHAPRPGVLYVSSDVLCTAVLIGYQHMRSSRFDRDTICPPAAPHHTTEFAHTRSDALPGHGRCAVEY